MSAVKGRKTVSDLRPPIAAIEDVLSGERRWVVALANSLELLPQLPDNCIDSCVVDPPYELGFMGKSWDNRGISFNPETWRKVLRVLKPGGHLLSFGGTRTVHRIAVAIEDAGFEIRDEIMWMYGSGSTGCGAVMEGFRFIGIEREPEYVKIARARITHWES